MKNSNVFTSILLLVFLSLATSCRQEEYVFVGTPPEQGLQADSQVANLMQRVTMNDGSGDNILDQASCLSVQLPVEVIVNGQRITVAQPEDLQLVEDVLDEMEVEGATFIEDGIVNVIAGGATDDNNQGDNNDQGDNDVQNENVTYNGVQFIYPIRVTLSDFTEVTVANEIELDGLRSNCAGEDQSDDDIECVDLAYPLSFAVYNAVSETIDRISFDGDESLYGFFNMIGANDIVNLEFPVSLRLNDGTTLETKDIGMLERTIDDLKDSCNEDDNNNYNDDDCPECTSSLLEEVLTQCPTWIIQKLRVSGTLFDMMYTDVRLAFGNDGTVTATSLTENFEGTWSVGGTPDDIIFEIDIPALEGLSATWGLDEIKQVSPTTTDIRLRTGNDKFFLESMCN